MSSETLPVRTDVPTCGADGVRAVLTFSEAVNLAMRRLAEDERTRFIGQSVCYDGATIFHSLEGVPMEKRLEMPVIEDFQMGYSLGLALTGLIPVTIYPRMDFLVLALNQLVNHLDKMPHFGWKAKVIVRTRVGGTWPLNAGPQHTQNHAKAMDQMLETVTVVEVHKPEEVLAAYNVAMCDERSWVIVEDPC